MSIKFRWWAGKAFAASETPFVYTGVPNPYTGIAEHLEQVTDGDLLDENYRRKHKMTLASDIADTNGTIIYEGDILQVKTPPLKSTFQNAYVKYLPNIGFIVRAYPNRD